uniref:Microfibril associated protein 5 n=1 Tax=Saimiri boliviensis boliviensis TaxID=39432 RepID=A0A2K6UJF3_SAIBB
MLPLGPKVLLFLAAFVIPSDWILLGVNSQRGDDVTSVTPETFTEDPNLVNDPATDETDELCRQMVGLPPSKLRRRSNYVLVNLCENVDLQKPSGL